MVKTSKKTWTPQQWKDNKFREAGFQRWLIGQLKQMKIYVIKVKMANEAGVPDLLVCYNGVFIGMELKTIDNVATPLQQKHINDIIGSGGIAGEVRCWKDAETLLYKAEKTIADKFDIPIRPHKSN